MRLSDFPLEYNRLVDMLDESMGEITPEIEQLLETLPGELNDKVERIGYIVQQRYATAEARREFAQEQNAIAGAAERSGLRLAQYTGNILQALGKPTLDTQTWNVSVYGENGPDVAVFERHKPQEAAPLDLLSDDDELVVVASAIRENKVALAAYEKMLGTLKESVKALEETIEAQNKSLCSTMRALGKQKIETPTLKARTQINSAPSLIVEGFSDPAYAEAIPEQFKVQPPTPIPHVSYELVKQAWAEAGKPDEWTAYETPSDEENGVPEFKIALQRGYHPRIS